MEDKILN